MDDLLTWSRRGYPPAIERLRARVRLGWWNRITVGRGWWPLLAQLDEQLVRLDPEYTLTRVEARDGILRFDAVPERESLAFDDAVWQTMLTASRTCEACSAPGARQTDVSRVLCIDHVGLFTEAERAFLIASGLPQDAFTPSARRANDVHAAASDAFFDAIARTHLTASEISSVLGLNADAVYERFLRDQLAGAERGGRVVFPRWQITDDGLLPGLHHILQALPDPDDAITTRGLMVSPSEDLDGLSPVEWISRGRAITRVTAIIAALCHA